MIIVPHLCEWYEFVALYYGDRTARGLRQLETSMLRHVHHDFAIV